MFKKKVLRKLFVYKREEVTERRERITQERAS
jgi:hypothetical protein